MIAVRRQLARARADRLRRRQVAQLPGVLHVLARELRAGRTLHEAVSAVAVDPIAGGPQLLLVVERIASGSGVTASMDRWAAELAHPDADLVRAVLNSGAATGGAMAATLDRAAASLRERGELEREIRALSAQARVSAWVLTVAPVAFLLVMATADRRILKVVAGTGAGRIALAVGLALDAAGWLWMRRMVAEVVR